MANFRRLTGYGKSIKHEIFQPEVLAKIHFPKYSVTYTLDSYSEK